MIKKNNVTEQVVEYYKQQIFTGKWKVGEKIPSENHLSVELGVSRASIRSAVKELIGIGVLQSIHGKGTFLIDDLTDLYNSTEYKITAEDCLDMKKVLEFRKIIEPEACYLAVQNVNEELVQELEETLKDMKANIHDSLRFVMADLRFHKAISKASGNPLIEKSMNRVFEENFKDHREMNQAFGYQDGIHYHTRIIHEIKSGEAEKARQIMADHLQNGVNRLKEKQN